MGGWREGRCQEAGREKLEECCKEQGQLAEASKEGLGAKWAVVPMMMVMVMVVVVVVMNIPEEQEPQKAGFLHYRDIHYIGDFYFGVLSGIFIFHKY
jgi:hypothetical protein